MAEPTDEDRKRAQAALSGPPLHEGWRAELTAKVAQALADQREALEAEYRTGYQTLLDVRGTVQAWVTSGDDDDRETLNKIGNRLGVF